MKSSGWDARVTGRAMFTLLEAPLLLISRRLQREEANHGGGGGGVRDVEGGAGRGALTPRRVGRQRDEEQEEVLVRREETTVEDMPRHGVRQQGVFLQHRPSVILLTFRVAPFSREVVREPCAPHARQRRHDDATGVATAHGGVHHGVHGRGYRPKTVDVTAVL